MFLLLIIKAEVRITAAISATMMELQIPVSPKISGRSKTAPISKTRVLVKEMIAESSPLLRAVKNEEPKVLKPHSRKEPE